MTFFLDKIMRKLGFNAKWVDLVMKCVTTVNYKVKLNGDYSEQIIPQRGLRQGDPLSLPTFSSSVLRDFQRLSEKQRRRATL
jgi:hypothetical protein